MKRDIIKKSSLAVLLFVTSCDKTKLPLDGYKSVEPVQIKMSNGEVYLVKIGYYLSDKPGDIKYVNDRSIKFLFDDDNSTTWIPDDKFFLKDTKGCRKIMLQMEAKIPAYFEYVKIMYGNKGYFDSGSISIEKRPDYEGFSIWESFSYLNKNESQLLKAPRNSFLQVLKANTIGLLLAECHDSEKRIEIRDIKFQMSKDPTFEPYLKLNEIESVVSSLRKEKDGLWYFENSKYYENRDEYLLHLIFYSLLGSNQAESLLLVYQPLNVDDSEYIGEIERWYSEDKMEN